MAVAGSALSPGIGLKLPPPTGGTQPRPSLSASGHGGAAAAVRVREAAVDIDPSSMLETPAPQPHMLHGARDQRSEQRGRVVRERERERDPIELGRAQAAEPPRGADVGVAGAAGPARPA